MFITIANSTPKTSSLWDFLPSRIQWEERGYWVFILNNTIILDSALTSTLTTIPLRLLSPSSISAHSYATAQHHSMSPLIWVALPHAPEYTMWIKATNVWHAPPTASSVTSTTPTIAHSASAPPTDPTIPASAPMDTFLTQLTAPPTAWSARITWNIVPCARMQPSASTAPVTSIWLMGHVNASTILTRPT